MKRAPKKRGAQRQKASPGNAGFIRIIAGQWRGRRLPVRDAQGLRPTTDRNKETLFNWLMHSLTDAHCLDMFAGSGGLGLEALSRYAASCDFFELDAGNARQLQQNLGSLNAPGQIHTGDAMTLLAASSRRYDIVFIDPPFGQGLVQPALDALFTGDKVHANSEIYVEQEAGAPLPRLPDNWEWRRQKQTPSLHYGLISHRE